jgi:DNA-binding NarL/FixJ family response regulator
MNILIVDDNPATRILITACFKKISPLVKLHVAGDDKTAIALARDNEISFGTVDFNLGETSRMPYSPTL